MNTFYKDKQNIIDWLEKHNIHNYTLITNEIYGFIVDVGTEVNLMNNELDFIPVKFNKIDGYFSCCGNRLTSLEFCPVEINGDFYCDNNKLTSLKHCVKDVNGSFFCSHNQLTSLEFCPEWVAADFYCHNNNLNTLKFLPQFVGDEFRCTENPELKVEQKRSDFNFFYAEHRKILAEKFSNKLDSSLIDLEVNKKQTKIKL